MGLDPLAARHAHDQLGVGAAGQRGVEVGGAGAAEAGVDVGDAQADLLVAERLHRARAPAAQRLDDAAAEVDQLLVGDHRALDRLPAARLDHRARDHVQAAAVEIRQAVHRELRPLHRPLDHRRLADVLRQELGLALVVGEVDGSRSRAPAGLDHHRVAVDGLAREHRRRRRAARGARAAGGSRTCRTWRARPRRRGRTRAAGRAWRAWPRISRSRSVSGTTAPTPNSAHSSWSAGT